MVTITVPLKEKRSLREEDSVNRLLVAAMFSHHEEVELLLKMPMIRKMLERGALQINEDK